MKLFKVQYIRSCSQCGDVLPQKCEQCKVHPDRKPRIIELFDWPQILQTGPCGCCIQIQCQRPGCSTKFWRYVRLHSKTGKATSRNVVCGKACAIALAGSAKAKKVEAPCAYCGAVKTLVPSILKVRRHIFCNPSHHYLWVRKMRFEAIEAARAALEAEDDAALLFCAVCRDVVECKRSGRLYQCSKGHSINTVIAERENALETLRMTSKEA